MSPSNSGQQSTNQVKFLSYSTALAMTLGLVVVIPLEVRAQSQPSLEAEKSTQLAEAEGLNEQGMVLYKEEKYSEAVSLLKRALSIREKLLGKEHPDTLQNLNNLALIYEAQLNYDALEPLYLRSLAIYEKVLSEQDPHVANILNNLAGIYKLRGNYDLSESLYLRSLGIREKVLGKEHSDVATSLNNLAQLYESQGSYAKAESLLLRSVAIYEKVLGKEHPYVASTLNNLGLVYESQGNYASSELFLLRSVAISEKALGAWHPDVASTLNNLGQLYKLQGSYNKAESLLLRALTISEKALGAWHPDVATTLNNLAQLYESQGSYAKAQSLLLRSVAIDEKFLGSEHPNLATTLNNLAFVHESQGNYGTSETLYLRSLAMREKFLGYHHPDVAQSLNNLAFLYESQGNYDASLPLYLRSLAIYEKALGKEHHDVAKSLNHLARVHWAQGDINRATNFITRGLAIQEKNLQLIYAVGSEQRKQKYAQKFSTSTDVAISLALQQSAKNPALAKLALTTVLRRKGRVLDAMTDIVQTLCLEIADNPETKKLFDDWLDVQQRLAALVYRGQGKEKIEVYQKQIKFLVAEKERLEEIVSAKSAEFRKEIQSVELADIQAQIPPSAALVEIVQYKPFLPKAKYGERFGKPRYAAVVLHQEGEPDWVDLGDAATIDKSVTTFRKVIVSPLKYKRHSKQIQHALYEQVMASIRPLLGDARHLLLSPDGQLNLIPFEALKDRNNKYLVERYAFSYLTTGRDLLRLDINAKNQLSNPVVFTDIDYGESQRQQHSTNFAFLNYDSLPATLKEGKEIKNIFPETTLITGKQANESTIKQLKTPSFLHLATHGFFLSDHKVDRDKLLKSKFSITSNPLLRSGLALADFNNRQNKQNNHREDGVLTALEVAGLNLRGTKLVVLSACETGLGEVKTGDGVYGLRRALVIAGSQSQLLSLWKVSDNGTKDLMVKYYENLKAGKGRHEALREVQLEFIKNPKYQHPYYWASFIPSGNWKAMKGK